MYLKGITVASTLVALSAAVDFNNGGYCDTTYHSSAPHSDTVKAATQLVGYFNNPSRNGELQIGAIGANLDYSVERQVGYSHAYFNVVDSSKPTNDPNIDTSEVTSALELLTSECTTGQVILSGGEWKVGIAVENHVEKRRNRARRQSRSLTPISDTSNETISVPLIEKRDTPIDAGIYNTYPQFKANLDDNVYPTKRNIDSAWDPNVLGNGNQDPSIAAMLEAVIAGKFQFQYSVLFRTRVTQEPDKMDGVIEMAWLIGDSVQAAQNNQPYQGHNPGGRADILFVVHLHTDQIAIINGQQYIGVQAMTLMHSQEMLVDQNRANVNDREVRSIRVVLNERDLCNHNSEDGFAWYPGYQTESHRFSMVEQGSPECVYLKLLLIRFGSHLHENGLLGENNGLFNDVSRLQEAAE
ncbi:hypothetical protein F4776DRAFT_670574 [Hypoxylon sp. NC0597]|nr:hypothetical protein F4776DRAFT_670574 [Hypoxylon sp. NC0597]